MHPYPARRGDGTAAISSAVANRQCHRSVSHLNVPSEPSGHNPTLTVAHTAYRDGRRNKIAEVHALCRTERWRGVAAPVAHMLDQRPDHGPVVEADRAAVPSGSLISSI